MFLFSFARVSRFSRAIDYTLSSRTYTLRSVSFARRTHVSFRLRRIFFPRERHERERESRTERGEAREVDLGSPVMTHDPSSPLPSLTPPRLRKDEEEEFNDDDDDDDD